MKRRTIPGSEKPPLAGAEDLGRAAPEERLTVTFLLRWPSAKRPQLARLGRTRPAERRHLSREEFRSRFGARAEDLARMASFAGDNGLEVAGTDPAGRRVFVSGPVSAFEAALGVQVGRCRMSGRELRVCPGPVRVPDSLAGIVIGVFGLDERPHAKPHFRIHRPPKGAEPRAAVAGFTPVEVAGLYDFPGGLDGSGQCVGLIELGGGYREEDLASYFAGLEITPPQMAAVGVDGGANAPGSGADGPDGEVALDIEVAGAVAPGARFVVYFAPNTDRGFIDAVTTAVHDSVNRPSILSISWGGPEDSWAAQSIKALDGAFQAAASMGVTVCCAAGDNGSTDGETNGLQNVDFPASSPNVLACGGTRVVASGKTLAQETVWNDGPGGGATGGGVSGVFALPPWQSGAGVPPSANPGGGPGRGVPDVAADADPATGYRVRVDGADLTFGGTSAVAPLWAGLIARCNQRLGRPVGYLNPFLYGTARTALHDIVQGGNGAYSAGVGWDACTGWGSPDGGRFLGALEGS